MLQIGRSLVRSQLVSLEFFIDIKSFRSHYGINSASNINEYQEYFLGSKGGRCVRLTTLPPSCAVVTKSGNLNFLEPSGPLQACNGTDLPSCKTVTFPLGVRHRKTKGCSDRCSSHYFATRQPAPSFQFLLNCLRLLKCYVRAEGWT